MIKLHQYNPTFGLPNASPFCLKLETYLRMAGLPYEAPRFSMQDFSKAPKGKFPYIDDNGKIVADSTFIIDYLKATYGAKYEPALDGWLNDEQRAIARAFQRLLEENLYWAVVYTRWVEPTGWAITKAAFFPDLPIPLKWFVPELGRRGLIKAMHGHGIGRHSEAEIMEIGKRDITAVADFLAEKPYFMGSQPCSFDATAYGFLANLVLAPIESPLKKHALQYPQLAAYCERMRNKYFG
jgi:glutathione S-transferase